MTRKLTALTALALIAATALPLATPLLAQSTQDTETALPEVLRSLGLSDIRTQADDDKDVYIFARMSNGAWLRAETRGTELRELQADGVGLADALIAAVLPEKIHAEPRFAALVQISEIDLDDKNEISIEGLDSAGLRVEIEYSRAGELRDFEREADDRRSLTEDAARARLTELGYTDVTYVDRGGRHVEAVVVNPFGDTVEVRLDDQGQIAREKLVIR